MTQQRCRSPIRGFLLTGAMLGLLAPVAFGQEAVITGKVTSELGDPIAGARISITNTNFASASNASGVYTLTMAPAPAATGRDPQNW